MNNDYQSANRHARSIKNFQNTIELWSIPVRRDYFAWIDYAHSLGMSHEEAQYRVGVLFWAKLKPSLHSHSYLYKH